MPTRMFSLNGSMKEKRVVIQEFFLVLIVVGTSFLVGCNLNPSERSSYCKSCHEGKGVSYVESSRFHKDFRLGKRECIDCHSDKGVIGSAENQARDISHFLIRYTTSELYASALPGKRYSNEQCLFCHESSSKIEEMESIDLPEKLKKIGLKFDHLTHLDLSDFSKDDQRELRALEGKTALSPEEKERMEFLQKVKRANCAQCHGKDKVAPDGRKYVDKYVNYIAEDPMLCTACHEDIDFLRHPGRPDERPGIPREESCRRCHDGKLHGNANLRVFLSDCESADKENCSKCHPGYLAEKAVSPQGRKEK